LLKYEVNRFLEKTDDETIRGLYRRGYILEKMGENKHDLLDFLEVFLQF